MSVSLPIWFIAGALGSFTIIGVSFEDNASMGGAGAAWGNLGTKKACDNFIW